MKLFKFFILFALTFISSNGHTENRSLKIISTNSFEREAGAYAAFPNLYLDINGTPTLAFTARDKSSHVNSNGIRHTYTSENCGLNWAKSSLALPPAVQYMKDNDQYRTISSGGWQKILPGKQAPKLAIIRESNSEKFYAQGLFEYISKNHGLTWERKPLQTIDHGLLMNHNIASQLNTNSGAYLTAVYYKEKVSTPDQVLIIRQIDGDKPTSHPIPSLDDNSRIGGNETALAQETSGRILAYIRPEPDDINRLYISYSEDDGMTWSTPVKSDISGYPSSAITHETSTLVTTANRKNFPLEISIFELEAGGIRPKKMHTLVREYSIRRSDFGYPITVSCNSSFITAYYRPSIDGGAIVDTVTWSFTAGN